MIKTFFDLKSEQVTAAQVGEVRKSEFGRVVIVTDTTGIDGKRGKAYRALVIRRGDKTRDYTRPFEVVPQRFDNLIDFAEEYPYLLDGNLNITE